MDISSISTNYTVANANKSAEQSNSLQSSLKNISSDSSEEQLKGVIKDFESYFVEQVIKQMKDTFTSDDDGVQLHVSPDPPTCMIRQAADIVHPSIF